MKHILYTILIFLSGSFISNAQQSYCTTDLYDDIITCRTINQPNNSTMYHQGIRDFILKGHGISEINDTGTACGTSNGGQLTQPGYSDRTSIAPVELRRDSTYTITVKQVEGYDSAGIIKRYYWWPTWVAIDFNDNFAFDTTIIAGEFVIVGDSPYIFRYSYDKAVAHISSYYNLPAPSNPVIQSFKIKIPKEAPYGTHRLRIRSLNAYAQNVLPCFKSAQGETQDYLVKIVEVPSSVGWLAAGADRFSLVPNPATASTTLQIPPGSATTEAQLIDVQGRTCATQRAPAGTTTLSFYTDALPAGLYFVKVTEARQPPVVLKMVK